MVPLRLSAGFLPFELYCCPCASICVVNTRLDIEGVRFEAIEGGRHMLTANRSLWTWIELPCLFSSHFSHLCLPLLFLLVSLVNVILGSWGGAMWAFGPAFFKWKSSFGCDISLWMFAHSASLLLLHLYRYQTWLIHTLSSWCQGRV